MAETQHDVVIIGSGPGGYVAGIRAGQLGLDVCVVEKDPFLGGTCLQRGCIPTKALLHTADLLQQARDGARFGVVCGDVKLDLKAAHQHKTKVVTKSSKGVEYLFRKYKVTWVQGTGKARGQQHGRDHEARRLGREASGEEHHPGDRLALRRPAVRHRRRRPDHQLGPHPRTARRSRLACWCWAPARWGWSSPRSSPASAPRSPWSSCWTASCRSRTRTSPPR